VTVEALDQRVDRSGGVAVANQRPELVDNSTSPRQIPVEVAMDRRMIEPRERAPEARDGAAEILDEGRRAVAERCHRHARQIGDRPDRMRWGGLGARAGRRRP
jgi:hypothetical protein